MYYSILLHCKVAKIETLESNQSHLAPLSYIQALRFHVLAHEVSWGLIGTGCVVAVAHIYPQLLPSMIAIFMIIMSIAIHPRVIGFDIYALDNLFPATLVRGFLFGFCYGFLQGDPQLSLLHAYHILLPLLTGALISFGYFPEFMRRRGFSDWISTICSSIIAITLIFLILPESIGMVGGVLIFAVALSAASLRLHTGNVWDAIVLILFFYIAYTNATYILHLISSLL